jgi:hypothetical protein
MSSWLKKEPGWCIEAHLVSMNIYSYTTIQMCHSEKLQLKCNDHPGSKGTVQFTHLWKVHWEFGIWYSILLLQELCKGKT